MNSKNTSLEIGRKFHQDLVAWSHSLTLPPPVTEALERLGIDTNAKLAAADPDALAFWTGIPSSVTRRWHDAATQILATAAETREQTPNHEDEMLANWIQAGSDVVEPLVLAANVLARQQIQPTL